MRSGRCGLCVLLACLLPTAFFAHQGLLGLDFGRHWDEPRMLRLVRESLEEGRLRPRWYHYPALPFLLARAALTTIPLPRKTLAEEGPAAARIEAARSARFRLRVRAFHLLVSSLAVLAAGLLAFALGGTTGAAFLASCFAAGSFELAYHARWFAPDAPLAAFGALAAAFAGLALAAASPRRRRVLYLASTVAAALAASCKVTGSVFLLAPLSALALTVRPTARALRFGALAALLFATVFLLVTPGALTDTARFLADLRFEARHYAEKGHYGFTVEPGLPHAVKMARWLALEALAPTRPGALLLFLLALFGAGVALARRSLRSRRVTAITAGLAFLIPVLLLPQRVLFVRNLLPLVPLLAALAGVGAVALLRLLPRPAAAAFTLGLAATIAFHVAWLERAAVEIRSDADGSLAVRRFAAWLSALPRDSETKVLALAGVRRRIEPLLDDAARARLAGGPRSDYDLVAFAYADHPRPGRLPSNVPELFVRWFGRRNVNLPYYTTWLGHHVFLVKREDLPRWHLFDAP